MTLSGGASVDRLRALGHRLAAAAEIDPTAARAELLAAVSAALPGAISSTFTTWSGRRLRPRGRASDSDIGARLDASQAKASQGPSPEAAHSGQLVWTDNLSIDDRWPALARHGAPAAGALALPLTLRGENAAVPVVCVYTRTGVLEPDVVQAATSLAEDLVQALNIVALHQDQLDLQAALRSNRAIGAAVGILMAHHLMSYDAVVDLLKRTSNHTNIPLADIADHVVLTGALPGAPPGPKRSPTSRPSPVHPGRRVQGGGPSPTLRGLDRSTEGDAPTG